MEDGALPLFVVGHVGIGLVAGRWRACLLPLLLVPLSFLMDTGDPVLVAAVWLLGVPAASLAIALGVGLCKLSARRARTAPDGGRLRVGVGVGVGSALLAIGASPLLLAGIRRAFPLDRSPEHPVLVDEQHARYRGVAVGDSTTEVRRVLGPPAKEGHDNGPIGHDFYDDGGPSNWRPPGTYKQERNLRFEDVGVLITRGRVYGFVITERDAETRRGVGVGDSLAIAKRRYPDMDCDVVNEGSEYATFPACRGRIGPGRYLGFEQDPIRTITLMSVPFY